ncbi:MAG: FKBP-type peptidyl-prolyl cis-trans isomerase [Chthoniobacterales bacterium]
MQISTGKVVSIDYTLTDDNKRTIDSSEGGDPLTYLHGVGQLIPGLEKELDGKSAGDKLDVKIAPADGYGLREDSKIKVVPRKAFPPDADINVGTQFEAGGGHGRQIVTVTKVEGDDVTIDANHPLAGATLHFDVTIRDVRDATPEELDHGHVHGPGGHHYH